MLGGNGGIVVGWGRNLKTREGEHIHPHLCIWCVRVHRRTNRNLKLQGRKMVHCASFYWLNISKTRLDGVVELIGMYKSNILIFNSIIMKFITCQSHTNIPFFNCSIPHRIRFFDVAVPRLFVGYLGNLQVLVEKLFIHIKYLVNLLHCLNAFYHFEFL